MPPKKVATLVVVQLPEDLREESLGLEWKYEGKPRKYGQAFSNCTRTGEKYKYKKVWKLVGVGKGGAAGLQDGDYPMVEGMNPTGKDFRKYYDMTNVEGQMTFADHPWFRPPYEDSDTSQPGSEWMDPFLQGSKVLVVRFVESPGMLQRLSSPFNRRRRDNNDDASSSDETGPGVEAAELKHIHDVFAELGFKDADDLKRTARRRRPPRQQ